MKLIAATLALTAAQPSPFRLKYDPPPLAPNWLAGRDGDVRTADGHKVEYTAMRPNCDNKFSAVPAPARAVPGRRGPRPLESRGDADSPRRRFAAPPRTPQRGEESRLRRGYSVETTAATRWVGGSVATRSVRGERGGAQVAMQGSFGRTNNRLLSFANLLLLAPRLPGRPAVVLPETLVASLPRDAYDWRNVVAALSTWVCVVEEASPLARTARNATARDLFFVGLTPALGHRATPSFFEARGDVLAQILLRPSFAVRASVDGFLRASVPLATDAGVARPYVAVHLRGLEKWCDHAVPAGRYLETSQRLRTADLRRGPGRRFNHPLETKDLCSMAYGYIDGAMIMDRVPKRWPYVLVHDGQQKQREGEIKERYGAVKYEGPFAPFVDLLLLVKSSYLLANPVSTFSLNAHFVRKARGAGANSTNLAPDLPPPGLREPVGEGPDGDTNRTFEWHEWKRARAQHRAERRARLGLGGARSGSGGGAG